MSVQTQSQQPKCCDLTVVGPEYSCGLRKIDMMKAVNGWEFHNVAGLLWNQWQVRRGIGTLLF